MSDQIKSGRFYDCKGSPAIGGDNCPFIKFVNPLVLFEQTKSEEPPKFAKRS